MNQAVVRELIETWPKKISVREYRRVAFVSGGLSINTIKKNIASGITPGEQEGSKYFVWVNKHLQPEWPSDYEQESRRDIESASNTGNEIADSIMQQYLTSNGIVN